MDWIEQLIGWAPDGGDGGLERLIALGAAIVLVAISGRLWWWRPLARSLGRLTHRAEVKTHA